MLVLELKKYNPLIHRRPMVFLWVLLFFFSSGFITAQKKVWLDKNHNETTEINGVYYRPAPEKKRTTYYIIDYYKDGSKYREGKAEYTTVGRERFSGVLTYYFNNGTTSKKERYRRGILDGIYKEYYPSGELKIDGYYDKGYEEGVWKFYHKTGKIKTKGKYKNGEKVGIWKTFYKNVYYPDDE
jgi:antitoxin component YwqK of YwqJK toxin-antitoxin module